MKNSEICCPQFDPQPFEEKKHIWKDKLFLHDSVIQFMHVPLNMGTVVTRMWKKIEDNNATPEAKDFLMLAYDPSPWISEIYMSTTRQIPNARMAKLSGTFYSKVYDGPYNNVPKWIKIQEQYIQSLGEKIKKHYFYYTTCPKCAKKYGHNYVVAFTQVKD